MEGYGAVYLSDERRRHRYIPVAEQENPERENRAASPAGIKWIGLISVLMFSAVLVGSSLKTKSAAWSSDNTEVRDVCAQRRESAQRCRGAGRFYTHIHAPRLV